MLQYTLDNLIGGGSIRSDGSIFVVKEHFAVIGAVAFNGQVATVYTLLCACTPSNGGCAPLSLANAFCIRRVGYLVIPYDSMLPNMRVDSLAKACIAAGRKQDSLPSAPIIPEMGFGCAIV